MLNSLPDKALAETTVRSLESNASVVDTTVLFFIGGGDVEFVTQFAIETDSTLHALTLAAPDDPDQDGWFKLGSYDLSEKDSDAAVTEAETAAAAYRDEFELDSEVEISGPADQ